jgi:hypothetical protein
MMPVSGPATVLAARKPAGNVTRPVNLAATSTSQYAMVASKLGGIHQVSAALCRDRPAGAGPGPISFAVPLSAQEQIMNTRASDIESSRPAPGPLNGVRVLGISTVYAAPIAAMLLGDYGADVLKIEHPRGDSAGLPVAGRARRLPEFAGRRPAGADAPGEAGADASGEDASGEYVSG